MLFIRFAYCIVISVDITDGNVNESVRILKSESNKWEVSLVSFDILEMKKRIEPCEFFVDFNEHNQFKLLINIEDPKKILNNNLLFNLSLFPQYDVKSYYRSSTFQFKITEIGYLKMVYIPSSVVALLIKLNLLYRNLIAMNGLKLSVSNCSLYKNYIQTCTFHNVDHVGFGKNRFKCDYQDYIAYVIGELNCVHNLNIHEGPINSLIANLFLEEESKIYDIYDIVKDDIDRLSGASKKNRTPYFLSQFFRFKKKPTPIFEQGVLFFLLKVKKNPKMVSPIVGMIKLEFLAEIFGSSKLKKIVSSLTRNQLS